MLGTVRDDVVAAALTTLAALVDGDRDLLEQRLATTLLRASPSIGATKRSRAAVLAIALNPSRRRAITPGVPLDRLVLLDEVRAIPLEDAALVKLPSELERGDVLVQVPLSAEGRAVFRAMLPGWSESGQILVRASEPPLVVGL